MSKDKGERRENVKRVVKGRAKKRIDSNGTIQRLRAARAEIKQLKAKLAGYEEVTFPAPDAPTPVDPSPETPPVGAVTPADPGRF